MNINKLKGKIVERGMSVEQLADAIGVSRSTLYRKLNNPLKLLTIGDALKIKVALNLTDQEAYEIFLAGKSHDTPQKENPR